MAKRRIGILTGGGDCPGLNAVIRGVAKCAMQQYDMEVIGFLDGFLGLIEHRYVSLSSDKVSGILTQGGTILGTSNKAHPFAYWVEEQGQKKCLDLSNKCLALYEELHLDALVCLGGDGTQAIAGRFAQKGMNVVGVPKTIDKDVNGTDETFGFDSARAMATEAIDRLHSTADAHRRIMFVEVMGRNAGWLALESGIAGGGDIIVIPEIPYQIEKIAEAISRRSAQGKKFSIVVVSEGARPAGGSQTVQKAADANAHAPRLGGCSQILAEEVEKATKTDCRIAVLGHLQRGGTPSAYDRLLATRFAVEAMNLVARGEFNRMVAVRGGSITSVPISEVLIGQRTVPLDSQLITTALAVGTTFGGTI